MTVALTKAQKVTLVTGMLFMAAAGLYVPWQRVIDLDTITQVLDSGYAFVASLPQEEAEVVAQVDYARILLEWAVIALLTLAGVILLGVVRKDRQSPGV